MGMAGAALFYGDAAITPGDLGALGGRGPEARHAGLRAATSCRSRSCILVALFAVQSRGTGKVATFFGPITLALVPAPWRCSASSTSPTIRASSGRSTRYHGVAFLVTHPGIAFAVLGSVCLAVTGAEALYADLGHFGRGPIRAAWLAVVFPALTLNYLGQGALAALRSRRRSRTRSSCSRRAGCCCRSSSSRRSPPSSRARR